MATDDSDRRLNLYFDDLDLDIMEWLNSFGKRKRARVAKEAIRRAMNEGFRSANRCNDPPVQKVQRMKQPEITAPTIRDMSKPNKEKLSFQVARDDPSEVDQVLLDLVGVEKDEDILDYLRVRG
ncbi:hypothetical protein [Desulfitobacterium hafniense]|uniref:hypothetical protein n=1 Tax=Desulfitobacterium hafniense TaxID=49338 RepID=UPI00035CA355|nr:hypothetical protein [Desulfitobacterium hafniense]